MPSPLATVFSTIDSAKRILADRLGNPIVDLQRTLGRAAEDSSKFREDMAAGGTSAQDAAERLACAFMPVCMFLLHGVQDAITRVLTHLGRNQAKGKGFYTSDGIALPVQFATNGNKRSGIVSVFDFPDPEYAKLLRLNDKPLDPASPVYESVYSLLKDIPQFRRAAKDQLEFVKEAEPLATANQVITGAWVDQQLSKLLGVDEGANRMAISGLTGKQWQYSADRPGMKAQVIFNDYVDLLEPVAQVKVDPGYPGFKAAAAALKSIMGKD